MKPTALFLFALGAEALLMAVVLLCLGCASRPQTCPPHDTRCQVLLLISTVDIGPKK